MVAEQNTYTGSSKSMKRIGSIIHIVAWGILFGIPFFFTGRENESVTIESYTRFVLVPLSFMFVFYVNYFILVQRYLFSKQTLRFLLANVILIAFTMILVHFVLQFIPDYMHEYRPHKEPPMRNVVGFFFGNAMLYVLVSALSVAIRMTDRWYKTEAVRKELERSRSEAELQNLKSQLNPHFLFNTLNNIYSLIVFSPERAQDAVHDLSRLLRYVLYESSHSKVPLEKELDFISNYVELMRIRLPENVKLSTEIKRESITGVFIAPLLFISLIENAFKHGVSNNKPSFINIFINVDDGKLICRIENSSFPKESKDKSGSGIGLVNLRKRLSLLYPGNYSFTSEQRGENYFSELILSI